MVLKPQDVVVVLKLSVADDPSVPYSALAVSLGMSPSEVHAAVQRATQAGLVRAGSRQSNRTALQAGLVRAGSRQSNRTALMEFLIHGLKYAFPADRSGVTRGMPTAHAAPPLLSKIIQGDELPPVWPDPHGTVRGEALSPLYESVPVAARNDAKLYECLALVDALRSGRARERKLAESMLKDRLAE